ncbi:hypothetical protein RND81_10G191200 [Saponaria officinalis]|uniref:F-box domain-containing protein n=1 Tax=Saponaria officinalis TaxID=3572 RepID=A0AAW1I6K5_SAPOF
MADLPDELWTKILENGVENPNSNTRLSFKDLCRLSLSSRRLHRLSNDPSLWSSLLPLDFPSRVSNPTNHINISPKLLYQTWFEKEKERRIAAEKRAVMRVESRVAEHSIRVDMFRRRIVDEGRKITGVVAELNDLRKVRQATVALNVWQPEVIRGRQKQLVEQCAVPVESRLNALEMELKLCKQQMMDFQKAYRAEQRRLEDAKEQLASLKYHPLQNHSIIKSTVVDHNTKRKKFKRSSDDFERLSEA